jgi:hypothetical protein
MCLISTGPRQLLVNRKARNQRQKKKANQAEVGRKRHTGESEMLKSMT